MLVEDPEGIKQIMKDCKTIAIVGFSDDPGKAGYFVADYLKSVGYKIIPVNPNLKWGLKEKCYSSLLDIPKDEKVDMVDCFRRSEFIPDIARDAVAIGAKVLWMQKGIKNEEAVKIASDAGMKVVHVPDTIQIDDTIRALTYCVCEHLGEVPDVIEKLNAQV